MKAIVEEGCSKTGFKVEPSVVLIVNQVSKTTESVVLS
jgi:hypothetical protein